MSIHGKIFVFEFRFINLGTGETKTFQAESVRDGERHMTKEFGIHWRQVWDLDGTKVIME